MNVYEYEVGKRIEAKGYPFYALVQAAMRQADTDNLIKLQNAWPHIWSELQKRYHAPGGELPHERSDV